MKAQKYNQSFFSRRNFILAALLSPLVGAGLLVNNKVEGAILLPAYSQDDFVILAGWVLLKDDLLTDNQG